MKSKFKYQFDNSLGILFKTYYGSITIDDIESSWKYAFENGLIPKEKKGFILDYRNSNFNIKIEEHIAIAYFYKKHIDIFGNYKIAIITHDPKDIVVPILVESQDDGYRSKPFSTLEAAIEWVLS
ncbi:MAG: hypothetical protein PF541_06895 [Prolixibacteraceae bacterium]|jgi:hypothetical protein|nr:hypothetical protein [Prolixibacteraceae bacterium]